MNSLYFFRLIFIRFGVGTNKQPQQNGYKHNTPKQSKPINNHQNGQQVCFFRFISF